MHWNGEIVVDLERRFPLDTNGVRVVVDAKVVDRMSNFRRAHNKTHSEADTLAVLSDLNHASQKVTQPSLTVRSVVQRSITHLVVATNSHQLRDLCEIASSARGRLTTASVMAQGFNPYGQNGLHTRRWLRLSKQLLV